MTSLAACAPSGPVAISKPAVVVSEACASAFDTASEAINYLYTHHPFYGPEYDMLYSDGEVTSEEQATLDAMQLDEIAQYEAAVDPTYDACHGVEEFYLAAYQHRDDADWSLKESEHLQIEDQKKWFLSSYCRGKEARPACSDFVADDWE